MHGRLGGLGFGIGLAAVSMACSSGDGSGGSGTGGLGGSAAGGAAGAADAGVLPDGAPGPEAGGDGTMTPDEFIEATIDGQTTQFLVGSVNVDPSNGVLIGTQITGTPQRKLDLSFPAQVGTAKCSDSGATGVGFYIEPNSYDAHSTIAGSSCDYVIAKFGAVDEVMEGSFTATLVSEGPDGGAPAQKMASGSFRVLRRN